MRISEMIKALNQAENLDYFNLGLVEEQKEATKKKILDLCTLALAKFGDEEAVLLSAPGRTEIGGNHTDHQHGRVLAGAVNRDIVAVAVKQPTLCDYDDGTFQVKGLSLDSLEVQPAEKNTTESLIRGVLAACQKAGRPYGGFGCVAFSEVLPGSGMSSSAAFEVLVGQIESQLYNEGKTDPETIAMDGQWAENNYFGKPCGLMDQMASSLGGLVAIDFQDPQHPEVNQATFDLEAHDLALCLVDTKGSHADLSDEYGAMPKEMKEVAQALGKTVLGECKKEAFLQALPTLRKTCSDRSLLRAFHFFQENDRVVLETQALENDYLNTFLSLVKESGRSSYMYLQNVVSMKHPEDQSLAIALALSEEILDGEGAFRVHGGGLAGTIQAFVPKKKLEAYRTALEGLFGEGSCQVLTIRPFGGYRIL